MPGMMASTHELNFSTDISSLPFQAVPGGDPLVAA